MRVCASDRMVLSMQLVGRRGNPLKGMSNRTGKREREARSRRKVRWTYAYRLGTVLQPLKLGHKKRHAFGVSSRFESYNCKVYGFDLPAVPVADAERHGKSDEGAGDVSQPVNPGRWPNSGGKKMVLDTTHDCWHGPYSQFMRWRCWLHLFISGDPKGATREALESAWQSGVYADQSVPINVLMNHSDCEGEIPAEMCAPIADALEKLLDRMPERGIYDEMRPATCRFISGLRAAAAAGEVVEFH